MDRILEDRAAGLDIQLQFLDATGALRTAPPECIKHLVDAMGVEEHKFSFGGVVVSCEKQYDYVTAQLPFAAKQGDCRVLLEGGLETRGSITRAGNASEVTVSVPFGYHKLIIGERSEAMTVPLIATPKRCWFPEAPRKFWGISLQLYLVRSAANWGIGDFADLTKIIQFVGPLGCDVVGINPLHQLDVTAPSAASPYSPLSRRFLNVLYISVPSVPGFSESEEVCHWLETPKCKVLLERARSSPHVDYEAVTALKLPILEILFRYFKATSSDISVRFEKFKETMGSELYRNSIFQALHRYLVEADESYCDWHQWPEDYRSPHSNSVHDFAERNSQSVDFYSWLQWLADEQLSHAAQVAHEGGMQFRLYRDLAIGADKNGADTWANPSAYLAQTSVGCPPDMFNLRGQDWGFPPFNPRSMRQDAYREYARIVAANMRHAGGLRIDHVMGLLRLYCIPEGKRPEEGAYVHYPLSDLMSVLALESHRHQCMVVGEDLGTVPEGFRETLSAAGVLSYRVLFFEQNWSTHEFIDPRNYPIASIAVGGNHDLPPLVGWWRSTDIEHKAGLGLYTTKEREAQEMQRTTEKSSFITAANNLRIHVGESSTDVEVVDAVHSYLTKSASALVTIQLDDLFGEADQVNLPGTFLEYPNWRRKYRLTLEEMIDDQKIAVRLLAIASTRSGPD